MLEKLKKNFFFAVIRGKDRYDGLEIARAAAKGGIKNIEITYTTPDASKIIASLRQEFSDDLSVFIGAGTVMNIDTAQKAIQAGAQFLVSPHFSQAIQKVAEEKQILYIPGCATATEIVGAMESGCSMIKLFPGASLGPSFIKDIHGPIPHVDLMPSGGVSLDNVIEWKAAGACAVGIGGALSREVKSKDYESVTAIAQSFVETVEV